jgi:hypothetical protein
MIGYGNSMFLATHGILARASGGAPPFTNQYSMTFDGVDEAVTTGNIDFTSAISISFWMKTTDTGSLNSIIVKDDTSVRSWSVVWRGTSSGLRRLYFFVWNTNGTLNTVQSTANILDDNNWHHILCTYNGTTGANGIKMYVDGVLNGQTTASSTGILSSNRTVTIGKLSNVNDWYFSGSLDEIAMWNTDQSANISTIYNAGDPSDLSSLTPNHWWRMGDGDTFSTNWTLIDNGSGGVNGASLNMEITDRTTDVP